MFILLSLKFEITEKSISNALSACSFGYASNLITDL